MNLIDTYLYSIRYLSDIYQVSKILGPDNYFLGEGYLYGRLQSSSKRSLGEAKRIL